MKAGIVVCSDAQKEEYRSQNEELVEFLMSAGIEAELSTCIYEKNSVFSGSPRERADQLMKFFRDPSIEEIYDISGGNVANQILDHLDYDAIARSRAVFWGYSDLSTVINAIYTMTGKESVLWQVKNMVTGSCTAMQRYRFQNRKELFDPSFRFVQGSSMKGTLVGGNSRCFLKLAGTKYFPDLTGKILLLEAWSGGVPQIATYFAQLGQLGAFEKVNGILLGTFTAMEKNNCRPDALALLKEYVAPDMPVAVTKEIGHGDDAKAIVIGREIELQNG